ncbi:hypothetical protein Adeg_0247 [Ammonifex degensii KC4]|uniref:Uncharacterized protein n=1 Tax=Ammonifex degensii (strain DSM 10501 / KC4) TaxID=429009 RepID=C9RAY9_AMMDK|nr:hypothetical protein Adeg_0247 [Ammonifex degensii KC4]
MGAGGLQSQIMYEGLAILRPDVAAEKELSLARNRTWPEEELVRLVEELNLAAALFNYSHRFRAERDKSGRVRILRYCEGEEAEEITPEEAKALKEKLQPKREGLDARA